MSNTILIDGDIVAYKAALACEQAINWGDDLWTLHADLGKAKAHVDETIAAWVKTFAADVVKIALTGSENFRKSILPSYKENRKDQRKPTVLRELKKHLVCGYGATCMVGLEADDVLGIWETTPVPASETPVIISIDKDFNQIPGYVFNPDKDQGPRTITEAQADYWHLYQTLIGDKTDGYNGCPGIGPVKAEKILMDEKLWNTEFTTFSVSTAWEAVVATYVKAGLGYDEALRQARVARILRYEDFDWDTQEPILWEPPRL